MFKSNKAVGIGFALIVSGFCTSHAASALETKPVQDLPNFHEVEPYFYRGGEPTKNGLEELKKMGIKTIIDLRNPGEMKFPEQEESQRLGIKYLHFPMDSKAPSKQTVDEFTHAVEEGKTANPDKPTVFVHCAHGSDRTGCMVGIWRVTHDGWDYEKAHEEMRKYYFTPKFTNLSGAVQEYADKQQKDAHNKLLDIQKPHLVK